MMNYHNKYNKKRQNEEGDKKRDNTQEIYVQN